MRHLEEGGFRPFTQGSSREFQTLPCEASVPVRSVHCAIPLDAQINEDGGARFPLTDCLSQRNFPPWFRVLVANAWASAVTVIQTFPI
jgi:hypothetical protein